MDLNQVIGIINQVLGLIPIILKVVGVYAAAATVGKAWNINIPFSGHGNVQTWCYVTAACWFGGQIG